MAAKLVKGLDAFSFDKEHGYTIGDFSQDKDEVAPIGNTGSNNSLAAYASVLGSNDPNDIVSNYMQVNNEQSLIGQSHTQTQLLDRVKSTTQQEYIPNLMDTLANPALDDATKQKAVEAVTNPNSSIYSPQNILTTKALSTPTQNSNPEEDQTRINIGDVSQKINADKANQQNLLNQQMAAMGDPDTKDKFVALIRGLIPGTDRIVNASIAAGMDPEHAKTAAINAFFTLSGNYRESVRDKLARADSATKLLLTQRIIDVANSHRGDLSTAPGYFATRALLQDTLNTGGYTPLEDNINSVMDAAAIAGGVGDVIKGASIVGRGAKVTRGFGDAEQAFADAYKAQTKGFKPDSYTAPGNPTGGPGNGSGGATFKPDAPETKPGTAEAEVSNTRRDASRSQVQPASVSQNIKDANVDVYRQINNAVDKDATGGRVAEATYGTTRDDALASDSLPEVGHADGSVKAKVSNPDGIKQLSDIRDQVPDELLHFRDHDGLTQYTDSEIAKTSNWKVADVEAAIAMNPRPEMFQLQPGTKNLSDTSTGFTIRGVYGPMDHGYSNPQDAIDLAKFALRNTGIPDADITLLKRVGDKYVPTILENEMGKFDPGFITVNEDSEIGAAVKNGRYTVVPVKGGNVKLVGATHGDSGIRSITAFDEDNKQVGNVLYGQDNGGRIENPNVRVDPKNQGKGIANAMYDYAEKHGAQFPTVDQQQNLRSEAGQAFREARDSRNTLPTKFQDGDYLIGIDHNYTVTPSDFRESGAAEKLTYKNNFLDRTALSSGRQGSLASTIVDQGSILPPTVYKSSLVGADKTKYFEKQMLTSFAKEFAEPFRKLVRERQGLLEDAIHKANATSTAFNYNGLKASGATDPEIGILRAWEKHQDILYHFRNEQFGKYLDQQGYQEFVHGPSQTNMVAKPVKKGSLDIKKSGFDVYDPVTGRNIKMSPADIDNLYKSGGTLGEVRDKFLDPAGSLVSHVVSGVNPAGGYLRKIIPGQTQVLAYRPGYFGVEYKHPHIIMRQKVDTKGKVIEDRAFATAADLPAAKLHTNRMNATSNGDRYYVRKNRDNKVNRDIADDYNISVANGQSSFRRRGKRLDGVNTPINNLSKSHIRNPTEVFVRSTRSLASKIGYGDLIASQDIRNANQFGHLLPKNEFGQTIIPGDKRQIHYRGIGNENGSEIADARSAIQYTNYLRNAGYLNILDDSTKAAFRSLADFMGEKDLGMAERLFSGMSDVSISKIGKTTAYTAFLALSPLRQFIVQSSQIVLLNAMNPSWMATKFIPQMLYASMRQMGLEAGHPISKALANSFGLGTTAKDADKIWQQFQRSGVSSAIDSNNMISGVLSDMASRMVSNSSKHVTLPIRAVKQGMHVARLVGFDAGEWINSAASWFAHRDLAAKTPGVNINDPRVLDGVTAQARNYTGSMNHAGDMPQNQNGLSLIAQFTQQSQKMLLNMTLNRNIPWGTKTTMAILMLGLFGLPTAAVFSKYTNDVLPDDPNDPSHQGAKNALDQGLEGWALNHIMAAVSGEKVNLDFSGSLNPLNVQGTYDLIHNMLTTNAGSIIAKTPSGSLLFGSNPRVLNFLKSVARYTHLMDDWATDPTDFQEVAKQFAKISSGYSSYAKAKYALEYGKKMSASGRFTDRDVSSWEAGAALFGIQTETEKRGFSINDAFFNNKTQKQADFNQWYKDFKNHLNTKYENEDIQEFYTRTLSEFARIYGNDPTYHQWLDRNLKQDIANGDDSTYQQFMRNAQIFGTKDINALIDEAPFKNEQQRVDLKQTLKNLDNTDPTEK